MQAWENAGEISHLLTLSPLDFGGFLLWAMHHRLRTSINHWLWYIELLLQKLKGQLTVEKYPLSVLLNQMLRISLSIQLRQEKTCSFRQSPPEGAMYPRNTISIHPDSSIDPYGCIFTLTDSWINCLYMKWRCFDDALELFFWDIELYWKEKLSWTKASLLNTRTWRRCFSESD